MSTGPDLPEIAVEIAFSSVDDQPDPAQLVDTMDQTARWPAIVAMRAFEADRLGLEPGTSLLDVGCGRGEVACALAPRVAPGGRVLGIDASETMLDDARARAQRLGADVEFQVGDATALDLPDGSVDAVRSERMLQWVPDVDAALDELLRVLRPGGRVSLIDTDWRTLAVDIPDLDLAATVAGAAVRLRGPSSAAGGRLFDLCRQRGLLDLDLLATTHTWTSWDLEVEDAPSGFVPFDLVVPQVVAAGHLDPDDGERFLAQVHDRARAGRFFMSLTMFAVTAQRPG